MTEELVICLSYKKCQKVLCEHSKPHKQLKSCDGYCGVQPDIEIVISRIMGVSCLPIKEVDNE